MPQNTDPAATLRALRSLDTTDCPVDLHVFHAELDAVMMEEYDENPEVVHVGTTAAAEARDDVEYRQKVLESLAGVAEQVVGGPADLPGSAGAAPDVDQQGDDKPDPDAVVDVAEDVVGDPTGVPGSASERPDADRPIHGRKVKYPRVDPPEVEDEPGQAIREDTPGYIPKAFPKLFPHGTGDYHCDRPGLRRTFRFEEWGRYVMLWHDGRFLRHTRFRYWLLDTMLRVMVPGV